jgi:hypothetical protein
MALLMIAWRSIDQRENTVVRRQLRFVAAFEAKVVL